MNEWVVTTNYGTSLLDKYNQEKKVKICRDLLTPSSTGKHSITSTTHPIPHIKTKSVDDGLRNIMLTLTLFLYGACHEGEPVLLPGFAIIG